MKAKLDEEAEKVEAEEVERRRKAELASEMEETIP